MFRTVANRLRLKLRSWLGIVDAPRPVQSTGLTIHANVMQAHDATRKAAAKIGPPKLPDGVIPKQLPPPDDMLGPYVALDSDSMAYMYQFAGSFASGLSFPGYAYLAELSQRSEYREPSATIADEMTREFIKLTTRAKSTEGGDPENEVDKPDATLASDAVDPDDADELPGASEALDDEKSKALQDKVEKINEALDEFCIRDHFRKLAELDGLFGRGQLYIDLGVTDPRGDELPLIVDKATIKKGSLKGFKVIEPLWTSPYSYNATNPMAADFYVPRAWFVMGRRVHASRMLTFISRELPDMLKPAYNFSGLSLTQLMESSVHQWLRTRNSVSDLIHNFSVMCLKTDMTQILSGAADKPGGLLDRARLFTNTRDNQGVTLLDMDREDLAAVNVPLSTLDKLQAQAQEHMAAPSHIPLVKLLGVSPAGLNASSEGEIQVFYDYIRARQQALFGRHLKTVLQIVQLHLFGEIDDAIDFEFVSLHAPTVKELAEIRKANAETDGKYVELGVISPDEVRVRVANDPESGYNNLSGDAPPPPQQLDAEHGAELGEESAQANHERSVDILDRETKQKTADDSAFTEADHPRAPDGKFGSGAPLDHGVLNIPGRTSTLNAQIDRWKREQAATSKRERKEHAAKQREEKALAKELLAEHGAAIIARHAAKFGEKELKALMGDWVKYRPGTLINFVDKFLQETASG